MTTARRRGRPGAAVPDQPHDAGHGRPDDYRDIRQVGQEGHGVVVSCLRSCPRVTSGRARRLTRVNKDLPDRRMGGSVPANGCSTLAPLAAASVRRHACPTSC